MTRWEQFKLGLTAPDRGTELYAARKAARLEGVEAPKTEWEQFKLGLTAPDRGTELYAANKAKKVAKEAADNAQYFNTNSVSPGVREAYEQAFHRYDDIFNVRVRLGHPDYLEAHRLLKANGWKKPRNF